VFEVNIRQFNRQLITGMALFISLYYGSVKAEIIPPGLSVSVQLELNPLTIAPRGAASQTASATMLGGGSEMAAISGKQVVAGSLPLISTMSEVGDSLAIEAQIEGDGTAAATGLLFDIAVGLVNQTSDESFTLYFQVHRKYSLNVNGKDAVTDVGGAFTNTITQRKLFNPFRLVADVYFDGQPAPVDTVDLFEIDLPPGESIHLSGSTDLQGDTNLFGLSGPDDHFDGNTSISLVLDEVQRAQVQGTATPTPIPTLSFWGMMLLGILLLMLIRRHLNFGDI